MKDYLISSPFEKASLGGRAVWERVTGRAGPWTHADSTQLVGRQPEFLLLLGAYEVCPLGARSDPPPPHLLDSL